MTRNRSGAYNLANTKKTREESMAAYDALPPHLRKILQDAPYGMTIVNPLAIFKSEKSIRKTITNIARESARATYGNKYPIDLIQF